MTGENEASTAVNGFSTYKPLNSREKNTSVFVDTRGKDGRLIPFSLWRYSPGNPGMLTLVLLLSFFFFKVLCFIFFSSFSLCTKHMTKQHQLGFWAGYIS